MAPEPLTRFEVLELRSPMSRPDYSLSIPSNWKFSRPNGTLPSSGSVADGLLSSEVTNGTPGTRLKPKPWRKPTAYTLVYRSYQRAMGTCLFKPDGPPSSLGQLYSGCVGGSRFNSLNHFSNCLGEFSIVDTSLSGQALLAARLKMKRADVNLGVAFAERNSTARLLGDTASRMGKSFNNLKRGRVRAAMRDLGISNQRREPRGSNVPNKWLEMQYGWKPLLSDIYGACDALSRRNTVDWRVTAVAQRVSHMTYERKFTGPEAGICVAQVECGSFARIDALPENDLEMSLASLGVTNPLLIAWELVPYSFVVDWVLPVGAWLEQIDALLGYKSVDQSVSTFTKAEWRDRGIRLRDPSGFTAENDYYGWKKRVELKREPSGNTLATFPRIKDPFSLGHMANGLALLASAFSRR